MDNNEKINKMRLDVELKRDEILKVSVLRDKAKEDLKKKGITDENSANDRLQQINETKSKVQAEISRRLEEVETAVGRME